MEFQTYVVHRDKDLRPMKVTWDGHEVPDVVAIDSRETVHGAPEVTFTVLGRLVYQDAPAPTELDPEAVARAIREYRKRGGRIDL